MEPPIDVDPTTLDRSLGRSPGGPPAMMTPRSEPTPGRRPGRRRSNLAGHHLALAAVLAATLPVAGTNSVWSADEGALLYQATAVADGRGWTFDHPFPAADPSGGWFPVHLAGHAADGGYIVLGKHTVFVRLAGWLHGVGGYAAVVAVAVVGALLAAAAAARLAARIDRRAAVPALWLAGVASPLYLAAYVAWAHTLAAALIGWALVGLTTTDDGNEDATDDGNEDGDGDGDGDEGGGRKRRRWRWLAWAGGAVALGASCLLRTEAVLAGGATTVALSLPAGAELRARWGEPRPQAPIPTLTWVSTRLVRLGPAALAGVGTIAGYGLDHLTTVERARPVVPPGDRWGGLAGRIEGFVHTWLRPDFSTSPEHLLLVVAAVAVVAAAVAVVLAARRPGIGSAPVVPLLGLAAGALLVRAAISPIALIPGLVIAFPLLFAGLALLRRSDLGRPEALVPAVFVALFWASVLATQYRYGGGGEWGGRYFAIGLPAAIGLAAPALVRAVDDLESGTRRRVLALGAVIALVPVAMGVLGLRDSRDQTRAITDRVDSSLVEAGDGADRPVVVTTLAPLGRWAWRDLDRSRWLLVDEADLPTVASRLEALGIERLVFVTGDADSELPLLSRYAPIEPIPPDPGGLDRVVIPVRAQPETG